MAMALALALRSFFSLVRYTLRISGECPCPCHAMPLVKWVRREGKGREHGGGGYGYPCFIGDGSSC